MSDDRTCSYCDRERHYSLGRGEKDSFCYRHYAQYHRPLTLVFHRDLPDWVAERMLSEAVQKKVCEYWPGHMPHYTAHFFHRSEVETVNWKLQWEVREELRYNEMPVDKLRMPHSYRGWHQSWRGEIIIFVDDHETPASIEWLFWHELAHAAVTTVPLIDKMFDLEDKIYGRSSHEWVDDEKHDAAAEEEFVGRLATVIGGGKEDQTVYDRSWWRPRVKGGVKYRHNKKRKTK